MHLWLLQTLYKGFVWLRTLAFQAICMLAELISADGYMERQATEACTSALYWRLGGGADGLQSVQRLHRVKLMKFSLILKQNRQKKKTHQPRDGRRQPVDPLDDARLDLVDQTARGEGEWWGNVKVRASESTRWDKRGNEPRSVAETQCCVFTTLFNGGHLVSVLVNGGCCSLM